MHKSKRKHDKHAAEWLTHQFASNVFVEKSCFVDVRKLDQVEVWEFEDTSIKWQIFVHIKGK